MTFIKTDSMKSITQLLSTLGRWTIAVLLCVSATAFIWQSPIFSSAAMAAPHAPALATMDAGDKIKQDNKYFVQKTADKVKEAAHSNADRVADASDHKGGFFSSKARRDVARIDKRANEDATRTQRAIDKNINSAERVVDDIKDTFKK
jgi:hypothetical protein